jgi:hypothetical protein
MPSVKTKPITNTGTGATGWAGLVKINEVAQKAHSNIFDGKIPSLPVPWIPQIAVYNTLILNVNKLYFTEMKITSLENKIKKVEPLYLENWGPSFWPGC